MSPSCASPSAPWRRVVVAMVLALVLNACGWHLRGSTGGDISGLTFRVDPRMGEGALTRTVTTTLRRLGATVVETEGKAVDRVVELLGEDIRRRTTATDERGRATAYELIYRIEYAVNDAEENRLMPPRVSTARGDYDADPLDTLGEQAQRERLTEDLRDEAVRLMISRVSSVGADGSQ